MLSLKHQDLITHSYNIVTDVSSLIPLKQVMYVYLLSASGFFTSKFRIFVLFIVILVLYQTENTLCLLVIQWGIMPFQQTTVLELGVLEVLSEFCFEVLSSLKGLVSL